MSEGGSAAAFLQSAAGVGLVGLALRWWNRGSTITAEGRPDFFRREGLAVVGLSWALAAAAGA